MSLLDRWFPPRARLIPFVPGGPFDIGTIASLYRVDREYCHGRRFSLRHAIAVDLSAWRYSRALQSEGR